VAGAVPPTIDQVRDALPVFVGRIEQVPPAYSAVKVGGARSYDLARGGKTVALAARPVDVYAINLLGYVWPILDLDIECGKGTYVRSIGRDLGARLGCGALVQTLRRMRIGPLTAEQGIGIDVSPEVGRVKLLPASVLDLP
jgi:tRNA pseudouridine55 synthase